MFKPRDVVMFLSAGAVVFGIGGRDGSNLDDLSNPLAYSSTALASAADNVTSSTAGRHLGFDTSKYPGDDAMQAWRDDGSYEWVGYYLPSAPCHRDDSWAGKRDELEGMGWGLAVVYVGQQTWGKTPGKAEVVTKYVKRRVRQVKKRKGRTVVSYVTKRVPMKVVVQPRAEPGSTCSTQFVSAARGRSEADDAIARTRAEGFPAGTVIFLDVEHMNTVPRAMRDYYKAWTARVLSNGRYRPGFYAHTANATLVYDDVKGVYDSLNISDEPPFWVAGNTAEFTRGKAPTDVGHAFAAVWQGVLDQVEERNGHRLPIDVNVAATPSPSAALTDE
ncbi:MAG TPA: glycoside hydrolase domain-containing protein [Gemmatimonadaceae bacterium]|nr:glycoside hydrolase domain-containing protein [Gemmatimonadaceae bacterium]